jgi:hypothetical protein
MSEGCGGSTPIDHRWMTERWKRWLSEPADSSLACLMTRTGVLM